jgi:hypothetical protein
MIVRFAGELNKKDVEELQARTNDKKIRRISYEKQDGYSYIVFELEDETKMTLYYPLEDGGITLSEGFP